MLRLALLTAVLCAPVAGHAQVWAHCHVNEPPSDAPFTTVSPAPFSGFRADLGIAAARTACGRDASADKAYIDARLTRAECGPETEIGDFTRDLIELSPAELANDMRAMMQLDADQFSAMCTQLAPCAPEIDTGYSEACIETFMSGGA